jgi:hypothetical protein
MRMQLTLFYRGIPLGVVERTENGYRYTSYTENEQEPLKRRWFTQSDYNLWGSFKREKPMLFSEFEKIISDCRRSDILEAAEINPKDSLWDKLVKLSHLNWHQSNNFYVQQTGDMEEESKYHLQMKNEQ